MMVMQSECQRKFAATNTGPRKWHAPEARSTGRRRMEATNTMQDGQTPPRRRARQGVKRSRTIRFDLSEREFGEIRAAAEQAGLAKGAFVAQAALAVARGGGLPPESPQRQAIGEFIRAAGLVRRIGVNLNQAVAKLNATGQRSSDLLPYAAESVRRAQLLDQAAEELRRRLRQ
jgi:Mobilization protein NikA